MKISVVIPDYNHAHYLPESIQSALDQTFRPHEIIVVDDGSKDDSREVVARYPVKYVFQQNAGLSAARNKGVAEATGDWVAFLDSDDIWVPKKLEMQAAAVGNEEMCYCATTRFYLDGHEEPAEYYDAAEAAKVLQHHNCIDPSSVIVKRETIQKIGGFNINMPAAEDWEAWLRLLRVCKFVGVPERLLRYRVTGTGMSADPQIALRSMEPVITAATAGLPWHRRFIQARRMRSVRYSLVALKYRDMEDYRNTLRFAMRGFCSWPSPVHDRAFKITLLELRRSIFG